MGINIQKRASRLRLIDEEDRRKKKEGAFWSRARVSTTCTELHLKVGPRLRDPSPTENVDRMLVHAT